MYSFNLYGGFIRIVKTQKIDKCLRCEREFLNEHQELICGIDVEYNLIYCYKCVRKAKKEQNIEIPIKTKSGREYNFKTKKSDVEIK